MVARTMTATGLSPQATFTVTLVSLFPGDYNSNGTVEQTDLDLVLTGWGEELFNPFAAGWINDLPSGPIDQEELDKVLLNWGTSVQPLGPAVAPEPSTAVLLFILSILSLAARRRAVQDRRGKKIICLTISSTVDRSRAAIAAGLRKLAA